MRRSAHPWLWPACVGLAALGCGRDSTQLGSDAAAQLDARPEPAETVYRVVLGSGVSAYEALEDHAHATLVAGLQGAHHVWTSFLAYGFDEEVLRMQISTGWDDTPDSRLDLRGDVAARPALDPDGVSVRASVGWPALVRDPLCQDGRALRVNLTVSDELHSASDTRSWILDVPAEYRPSDCDEAAAP